MRDLAFKNGHRWSYIGYPPTFAVCACGAKMFHHTETASARAQCPLANTDPICETCDGIGMLVLNWGIGKTDREPCPDCSELYSDAGSNP